MNLQIATQLIMMFNFQVYQTCNIVKGTTISTFSKIGSVDQSKPCTQMYLQKS